MMKLQKNIGLGMLMILLMAGAVNAQASFRPQPSVSSQSPVNSQPPVSAQSPVNSQPPVNSQSPASWQPPVNSQPPVSAQSPASWQPPVNSQPITTEHGRTGMAVVVQGDGSLTSDRSQSLAVELDRAGFSDVRVSEGVDGIRIAYENLDNHSDARALAKALRIIAASSWADSAHVSIVIQSQRIPVVYVGTVLGNLRKRVSGASSHDEWMDASTFEIYQSEIHGDIPREGRSWQGMELRFGVGMRYQLGDYYDPWQFAFDFQPELRIPFGTGWYASVRGAIPIYNNLDLNDYSRLSMATLNKVFRLDDGLYGGISAGFFGRNRVGIHGKLQAFLWDEVVTVTLDGGITDFTDITGKVLIEYLENRRFTTYSGGIAHRWREFDLNTSVRYGNFLYYDSGVIAETYRQFGDLVIGFFYMNTRLGDNIGFRFDIPLFPRRSVRVGPTTVGVSRHIPVTYRYTGGMLDAREYETGLHFFEALRQMYPSFLAKQLAELL